MTSTNIPTNMVVETTNLSPSLSRTSSSTTTNIITSDIETTRTRHFVARLIDAGAVGLADTLVSKLLYSNNNANIRISSTSTAADTEKVGTSHPMELVKQELVPITWLMWFMNLFCFSLYINEPGSPIVAGVDLTSFVHRCCFRSAAARKVPPHSNGYLNQRVYGCFRRENLPFFYRIHNSYVTWNAKRRVLIGTLPTSDEFGFLKRTVLQHLFICGLISFLLMIFTGIVFPGIYGFSPQHIHITQSFDMYVLADVVYGIYGTLIPIVLVSLFILLVTGPTLLGSRTGSLPSLMPHLLQATAPEFMISYAWTGGMSQLARALGESLPGCWLDVRSLGGGQLVSKETFAAAATARVTILLLTPQYLRSRNCAGEFLAVISRRQHKGPHRCHKTVVLIENELLQGPDGIGAVDPKVQEYREILERSGYAVTPSNPEINWKDVAAILREIGCVVVHTVDDLLSHLQSHGCRATTHEDRTLCLHWWTKYGTSAATGKTADLRVPWNILGSKAQYGKRRLVPGICERWRRACLRRRPYKHTNLLRWEENSVTTGIHGAWIRYDAATKPQPHADITPQFILGLIYFPFVGSILAVFPAAWDIYMNKNADFSTRVTQFFDVLAGLGGGYIAAMTFAGIAFFGLFFYSTEIFTPASILHSPILFPFFALAEVQDVSEMDTENELLNTNTSSESIASPTNEAFIIRNPMTLITNTTTNNQSLEQELVSSIIKPSKSFRRKFTVQFAHNDSEIQSSIEYFNAFLAQHVFGFDKEADRDRGYPDVGSAEEILNNPTHPRPLTVYVFFLDTERSQKAWIKAMQNKNNRWRPEQVVLVTNRSGLNTGTDLITAENLLKKLLILQSDTTGTGNGNPMIPEILRCFDTLDKGEPFSVTPATIPSSQAAREALHELLPQLGYLSIPYGTGMAYTSPLAQQKNFDSPFSNSQLRRSLSINSPSSLLSSTDVPLLVPTLGPLLTYGPAESTTKRRVLEALEKIRNTNNHIESNLPSNTLLPQFPLSSIPVIPSVTEINQNNSLISTHSPHSKGNNNNNDKPNSKASSRISDHMLIVYESILDSSVEGGKRAAMTPDSPYRGLVPAVLEAVALKFGPVLTLSGMSFAGITSDNDV